MANDDPAMERERERNAYHAMLIQKLQDGDMLQVPYKNDIFKHYCIFSMTNKTVFHRNDVPGVDNTRSLRKIFWGDNNFSIQESSFESQTRECFAQLYTDLDPWFKPLEGSKIIKEAQGKLGKRGYNLFSKNCEHFANQCRINIRICQQMINVFYWTWMIHFTILVTLEMCELYTNYTRNFLPENCNRYYHRIGFTITKIALEYRYRLTFLLYRFINDNVINGSIVVFIAIAVMFIIPVTLGSFEICLISIQVILCFFLYLDLVSLCTKNFQKFFFFLFSCLMIVTCLYGLLFLFPLSICILFYSNSFQNILKNAI